MMTDNSGILSPGTPADNGDGIEFCKLDDVSVLPSALIVTDVPKSVFADGEYRTAFESLFTLFDTHLTFEYFKSFRRVRVRFTSPEATTAARMHVDQRKCHGSTLKCYYAQILTPSEHSLGPPPLEKQFLISPPCSPPVGWAQTHEAPPIFNFDLIARLSVFAEPDTVHELHAGTDDQPAIIVSPAGDAPVVAVPTPIGRAKIQQTRRPPTQPIQ